MKSLRLLLTSGLCAVGGALAQTDAGAPAPADSVDPSVTVIHSDDLPKIWADAGENPEDMDKTNSDTSKESDSTTTNIPASDQREVTIQPHDNVASAEIDSNGDVAPTQDENTAPQNVPPQSLTEEGSSRTTEPRDEQSLNYGPRSGIGTDKGKRITQAEKDKIHAEVKKKMAEEKAEGIDFVPSQKPERHERTDHGKWNYLNYPKELEEEDKRRFNKKYFPDRSTDYGANPGADSTTANDASSESESSTDNPDDTSSASETDSDSEDTNAITASESTLRKKAEETADEKLEHAKSEEQRQKELKIAQGKAILDQFAHTTCNPNNDWGPIPDVGQEFHPSQVFVFARYGGHVFSNPTLYQHGCWDKDSITFDCWSGEPVLFL